jgi:hypothetical protein
VSICVNGNSLGSGGVSTNGTLLICTTLCLTSGINSYSYEIVLTSTCGSIIGNCDCVSIGTCSGILANLTAVSSSACSCAVTCSSADNLKSASYSVC